MFLRKSRALMLCTVSEHPPKSRANASATIVTAAAMSENHIIVGSSDPDVSPKRVFRLEATVKGGTCRSCGQKLNVGEARIKVSYPNVIVQYAARTGSPSFYMHPTCFETQPVDFWRIGSAAYKDTLPVHGFAVNPEIDVIGYDQFPELQHCFDKSRLLYLKEQEVLLSSKNDTIPCPDAEPTTYSGARTARCLVLNQDGSAELPVPGKPRDDLRDTGTNGLASSQIITNDIQSRNQPQENLQKLCPQKRRAEYVRHKTAPQPKYTFAADDEDERLAYRQFLQSRENGVYDRILEQYTEESAGLEHQAGSQDPVVSPSQYHTAQGMVLKEPCVRMTKCCSCSCHFPAAERQWASPQDAAEILGISTAILRSLAHARAVPIFVRPSGQRVYNIPSIRKYIRENTLQAVASKP